ncbi:MAG: endonuclease [Bacteroidota bacterium]
MKRFVLKGIIILFFCIPLFSKATIPPGYYDNAAGLSGAPLKTALHNIINNHTVIQYADLWNCYYTTDDKSNGKVWDIYSDIPGGTPPYEFTFSTDQCGTYSQEADCYNREHTFPSSWFNDATPMYSDLFHVYPTDGWVNNKRSNYPYGDVSSASWTSQNGSKLGSCSDAGYSGTVFEPVDSFKGDIARTYFYMAVRYYTEDSGWPGSDMVNGAQLLPWAETMLLQWNTLDPVSLKEQERNDAVYAYQNNRNPFIDHPEWIYSIWGPTAGIQNISSTLNSLNIFPVPSKGEITINTGGALHNVSLTLYSAEGKYIFEKQIDELINNYSLYVSDAANGFYFVKIICDEGVEVKKVIVEKP